MPLTERSRAMAERRYCASDGAARYGRHHMPREPIVYAHDRPDVEVLYEGVWCPGEVRMVRWVGGAELHQVQYRRPGELSSHIDTFPASEVRADTVEPGRGRG
jgi:hypothetical protein